MKGQLRIDTLFAFIVLDEDGTEGVPAFRGPGGAMVPMLGADEARLSDLRPMATMMAAALGKPIELVRFRERESVEWIEPPATATGA